MCDFLTCTDLWANIFGGVGAALIFALIVYLWNLRKQMILKALILIMGRAIVHRNIGELQHIKNVNDWI